MKKHIPAKLHMIGIFVFLTLFLQFNFVFAAASQDLNSEADIIQNLAIKVVQLIIALILLMMAWGLYKLFFEKGEADVQKGREFIIYGIVSLAVFFSVWGLVAILQNTFKIDSGATLTLPKVPGP